MTFLPFEIEKIVDLDSCITYYGKTCFRQPRICYAKSGRSKQVVAQWTVAYRDRYCRCVIKTSLTIV